MTNLTHGDAQDLLAAFKRGWEARLPDVIVDLFADGAEYYAQPFGEPLIGTNAIRGLWNDIAADQANVEFDAERMWVSGSTVLASWHAAYTRRQSAERIRSHAFMTLELDDQGKIARLREWPIDRVVGHDSSFKIEEGDRRFDGG